MFQRSSKSKLLCISVNNNDKCTYQLIENAKNNCYAVHCHERIKYKPKKRTKSTTTAF